MTVPLSATSARDLVARLRRMAGSPSVAVDGLDRMALAWAMSLCELEASRLDGGAQARPAGAPQ